MIGWSAVVIGGLGLWALAATATAVVLGRMIHRADTAEAPSTEHATHLQLVG